MDPLGWRWQASTEVAILLSDFAGDVAGLAEDAVLSALNERDYPGVPGLFSARAPLSVAGRSEDADGDSVVFHRLGTDNNGRKLIFATITSRVTDRAELVDGIRLGVNHTRGCRQTKEMLQLYLPTRTTSLRVTHLQHPDVPSFPGSPIGIDSAWKIAIGKPWRGTEAAMRCSDVQRDIRLDRLWSSGKAQRMTPEELCLEQKAVLPESQRPACRSDGESISITGIPNEWIFRQAGECGFEGRASSMPLADLLVETEVFLGLYDRPAWFPDGELRRLTPVIDMLQRNRCRIHLRNDRGRRMITFRGEPIGEINTANGRIQFCPVPNADWSLWSAPLDKERDFEAALAALILDVAWAREILDDGRHLSSFLGPIAGDYPDLSLTANYDLRLDDGRDDRPNPMARFKRKDTRQDL